MMETRMSISIMRILFALLFVYSAIVALFYFFQSYLVFVPSHNTPFIPPRFRDYLEEITLKTPDDVLLHAWFVRKTSEKTKTVIFCHGNSGNIGDREATIEIVLNLGLNILIFDYRGYGLSTGRPSEQGLYTDVLTAYNYLLQEKGLTGSDIIVWGRSLGGSVAAWLASEATVAALIVESSFSSVPELGKGLYPYLPVQYMVKYQFYTKSYLQKRTCPLLIIHSPQDGLVAFSHGQHNYQLAAEPKAFLEIEGDHNSGFLVSEKHYTQGIRNFLQKELE